MKKMLLFGLLLLAACQTQSLPAKAAKTIFGAYQAMNQDNKYTLFLYPDSTFLYVKEVSDIRSECQGNWKLIARDTLIITCIAYPPHEATNSIRMAPGKWKVAILNEDEIRIDTINYPRVATDEFHGEGF